ncbi:MAG: SCP2 sterol-binding domain-containing protein [Pseudomonadota bacterium]
MSLLLEMLKPAQNLLNQGFANSRKAREISAEQAGKILALYATNPNFSLFIEVENQRLKFMDEINGEPNATLGGSFMNLIKLATGDQEAVIRSSDIIIDGDASFAQAMQELMAALRPDPEEELSKVFGDVMAHQMGRAFGQFTSWANKTADTFSMNFREFLSEESREIPTRYETEEFMQSVDELRDDIDRMIARFESLKSKV